MLRWRVSMRHAGETEPSLCARAASLRRMLRMHWSVGGVRRQQKNRANSSSAPGLT
ncbi:uncharacterized protein METZ01_LOCUS334449 [marine metagenome]|uniref:Uncharacterized protein n=1 Tax=marine metagenome TaxID=408172 RepID=A0A382Q9I6_9ZZZZ